MTPQIQARFKQKKKKKTKSTQAHYNQIAKPQRRKIWNESSMCFKKNYQLIILYPVKIFFNIHMKNTANIFQNF